MEPVHAVAEVATTSQATGTNFFMNLLGGMWGVLTTALVIFLFVMWFWLLITVVSDLFRRKDIGGFAKVLWILFLVLLPLLGVLAYVLTQSSGMSERQAANVTRAREELRDFVGVSTADEIIKLDKLKADGSITADEYARLRARLVG